jgi:hypothetical protein
MNIMEVGKTSGYQAPKLVVYGSVAQLTASGSRGTQTEGTNQSTNLCTPQPDRVRC